LHRVGARQSSKSLAGGLERNVNRRRVFVGGEALTAQDLDLARMGGMSMMGQFASAGFNFDESDDEGETSALDDVDALQELCASVLALQQGQPESFAVLMRGIGEVQCLRLQGLMVEAQRQQAERAADASREAAGS